MTIIISGAMVGVLTGLTASTVLSPPSAQAAHSVPNPKYYWDCNGDGVADDFCVQIERTGGGWDAARQARFSEAVAEWRNDTDFDPVVAGGIRDAYVDNRPPSCGPYGTAFAVTCRLQVFMGTHYRLTDADLYFNTAGKVWNTADAADLAKADFEGVATHEIGHFVRLLDLSLANCGPVGDEYTMCGSADNAKTFRLRNLRQDDIDAANNVY